MRKLIAAVRGYTGVALGFVITLLLSIPTLIVAPILANRLPNQFNPVGYVVLVWAWLVHHICYRLVMGLTVEFGEIPKAKKGMATVAYGTHPPKVLFGALWLVAFAISHHLKMVAKKEIVKGWIGWLLGKATAACGLLFLIDRSNPKEIFRTTKEELTKLPPGTVLIIMADTHQPEEYRLEFDREKYSKDYPEILGWHSCMPRTGLLLAVLDGYKQLEIPVQLIRFGIGFTSPMKNGAEVTKFQGATLRIVALEGHGDDFPRDEDEAGATLRREWTELHGLIYTEEEK